MSTDARFAHVAQAVHGIGVPVQLGRVMRIGETIVEATMPGGSVGDLVSIERAPGDGVLAELIGFRDEVAQLVPLASVRGLVTGAPVMRVPSQGVPVGPELLGRVVDPFGRPLDNRGPLACRGLAPVHVGPPPVWRCGRVNERFGTGVRTIDGLLTCGKGQRVGIFAGAGVGKSVLVEQIASNSEADVVVLGLIGERGREVREVMAMAEERSLIAVAATSDRSPMERARGALVATAIAEYFRDRGADVLLVIDSLTRYAMALREIGGAAGELPATKGYPASVFAALPRLVERVAPLRDGGSITGFYTVLVEGDDMSDPIADSVRSLIDGHIILSRELAARGHFPAIDVLASASRVALQVTDGDAQQMMSVARRVLAERRAADELRSIGAYTPGVNANQDAALAIGERLDQWMQQRADESSDYASTMTGLRATFGTTEEQQ